jgi:hypothetical protein
MTPETDTPAKPVKPTRSQREVLTIVRERDVRRFVREQYTRTGKSTMVFFWAPVGLHGQGHPGAELSAKVIDRLLDRGWIESRSPDRKPTSVRDMVAWQTEATLHITDAGLAFL